MRSKIWISDWSPAECDRCRVGYFLVVLESMRLNSRDNTWDFDTWWFMLQGDTKNDTKYDTRILTANFMDLSKIQKLCTQNLWQLWFRKIPQFWRKNVLFKKFCTHLQEIGSLLEIWANFWRKILKLKNTKKKFSDRVAFFEQAIKVASTTKRRSSIDKSSVTSKCNFYYIPGIILTLYFQGF